MATTITPATATITLTCAISLAGQDKGFSHEYTVASVTEVFNRIVAINTSQEVAVLTFVATNPGTITVPGLNEADVRFVVLTNLDDTNFIQLIITNEDSDEIGIKLEAKHSFILPMSNEGVVNVMDAAAAGAVTPTFGDLTTITAVADTGECDLQIVALMV
jgi:hypothetical protein|tara:strand:- start:6990 stop:7472 length:483 start_codon:yes stop_codon:yes gene_type:complete